MKRRSPPNPNRKANRITRFTPSRVQRILDDLHSGQQVIAELWIQMEPVEDGKILIHNQYFALRDAQGTYRGMLEVSQDVTGIRSLQGERRLMDENA